MIKSIITNWQLHHITLPEKSLKKVTDFFPELKGKPIMVFTGTIYKQYNGYLREGDHTRSSVILKLDRKRGLIKTKNSIYKMINEGNDVFPDMGNNVFSILY
jgi:hypothetical protein